MKLIGIDIGGVYIKSALIEYNEERVEILKTRRNAFNFRVNGSNLEEALKNELKEHLYMESIDGIAVTITAETVGIFETIDEGVIIISSICADIFKQYRVGFISVDGQLHSLSDVLEEPLNFASANWVATSHLATKYIKNGFFIDTGSTTTDIIPIINGIINTEGKTDMMRLISGELIYAGILRTYIQCLVTKLPYNNGWIPLSSEIRCFTAHIYVYLGLIDELEMLHPFSGKEVRITKKSSRDAIARSVCADIKMLSEDEIEEMATYIYMEQVKMIQNSIAKIIQKNWNSDEELSYAIAGSGAIIVQNAIEGLGVKNIVHYSDSVKDLDNATAVALAYLMVDYLGANNIASVAT